MTPQGPELGEYRILRSGGFAAAALHCRSASRARNLPNNTNMLIGFRVVCNEY